MMNTIAGKLRELRKELPEGVKLVAVSKTKPPSDIILAYNEGQRVFGENRTQELMSKKDQLPGDIEWHLIGHLQTNKVKYIVPFISLIQSVDTLKLLRTIDSESAKINVVTDCLLQVYIAREETKYGFERGEVMNILSSDEFMQMKNIRIRGLMGMATFTDNKEQVRSEFKELHSLFIELKESLLKDNSYFNTVSMGMSGDFRIAIEEGSTMVRLGSSIFGERYKPI